MNDNLSDIELIRQVLRENNPRAFEILMQRYSLQVYSAAMRLMHNEEDAQEVTQMAFIQAYKQLASWQGGNFGAWVTVIANHIGLRLLEKEKRRGEVRFDDAQCTTDVADETYNVQREQQLQIVCMAIPVATVPALAAQRLYYFSPEV